ncbi:hypothetical protein FRC03_010498 [Tulasnella sp. 419]|nr:hypothetical protein FRC02_008346 [Tulasnella sp. 418]KAG8957146.1 hypothetical protein FRC03_010498 [Tulasnella sp. 419]
MLVVQDRLTETTNNKELALKMFTSTRCNTSGSYLGPTVKFFWSIRGIGMIQGYLAYAHPDLVTRSVGCWKTFTTLTFDARGHINTSASPRGCTLDSTRSPKAILALNDTYYISFGETVAYMTPSAYLAESTGELKYLEAAVSSASFIEQMILDNATMLINTGK